MKDFQICVENSAPSQSIPAKSAEWGARILRAPNCRKIIDLGCGRLRNLPVLMKHFETVTVVDTKIQFERIKDAIPKSKKVHFKTLDELEVSDVIYDGVFCISVLHTIPKIQTRRHLIKVAHRKLRSGGLLLVDVPASETYYLRRCNSENRYSDGWVMGRNKLRTFYRNYSANEMDEFIQKIGTFRKVISNNQVKHITRIFEKD
jgi:SAM-dependent methyltransferase